MLRRGWRGSKFCALARLCRSPQPRKGCCRPWRVGAAHRLGVRKPLAFTSRKGCWELLTAPWAFGSFWLSLPGKAAGGCASAPCCFSLRPGWSSQGALIQGEAAGGAQLQLDLCALPLAVEPFAVAQVRGPIFHLLGRCVLEKNWPCRRPCLVQRGHAYVVRTHQLQNRGLRFQACLSTCNKTFA